MTNNITLMLDKENSYAEGAIDALPGRKCPCLVVCGSFEARCSAFIERIVEMPRKVVVLLTRSGVETSGNEDSVLPDARLVNVARRSGSASTAYLPLGRPIELWRTLLPISQEIVSIHNAAIDITTMPREVLCMLYRQLDALSAPGFSCIFYYVPAASYGNNADSDRIWLSSGVVAVRAVVGFSGVFVPGPRHLIIMNGFEVARAAAIIESIEPSGVTIVRTSQSGSISPEFYQVHEYIKRELRHYVKDLPDEIEIYPNSMKDTLVSLRRHIDFLSHKGVSNVCIAPLNTKLTSLAAAELCVERPNVQLLYAQPGTYNTEAYSEPQAGFSRLIFRKKGSR